MKEILNYFQEIFSAIRSLTTGMKVTGKYFAINAFTNKQVFTQAYPENRKELKMYDAFRGEVIMKHNENNEHRCNGCGICELNCPNGSIEILTKKENNEDGKAIRAIDQHVYQLAMCTFCGLCIKACPSNALDWGQDFEHAVFDRSKLTKVLNQPGSKIQKDIKE